MKVIFKTSPIIRMASIRSCTPDLGCKNRYRKLIYRSLFTRTYIINITVRTLYWDFACYIFETRDLRRSFANS